MISINNNKILTIKNVRFATILADVVNSKVDTFYIYPFAYFVLLVLY